MTFDPEALRPLILDLNGNIAAVAKMIDADSEELRAFVMSTPVLRRAVDEVIARGVDGALKVLFEGLDDQHFVNRIAASKEFLKSRAAQRRGFHHAGDLELKMPKSGGALTLTWLPPEETKSLLSNVDGPPLIEGKVED
jgi:hypothetical protein